MENLDMSSDSATNKQPGQLSHYILSTNLKKNAEISQSSRLSRLLVIWFAGTIVLMPIKIIDFPSNFELVDIWILMGLPVFLLFYSIKPHGTINLTYAIPIWLVMISSLLSTFASPAVSNSLVVMLKEIYLFIWFMLITAFLSMLNTWELRHILYVWTLVVILHGLLMITQFLSPEVWQFTNSLGGNLVKHETYRPSGLFICDSAGCANKAAIFQYMGFVPLLLAGFSRRTVIASGIFLFVSILITGSMGATLAFLSGTTIAGITFILLKKDLLLMVDYFLRVVLLTLLLGWAFYALFSLNISPDQKYLNHLESILVGRYEKSSGARFNLWQRGIEVMLDHDALLWGVGPENFRVLDPAQSDNQLHNDALAFLVERGLIGFLGLGLFAGIAVRRALSLLYLAGRRPEKTRLEVVVFLAALVAILVESLTHQVFRTRELWLVLALQEAVYFGMMSSRKRELMKPYVNNRQGTDREGG